MAPTLPLLQRGRELKLLPPLGEGWDGDILRRLVLLMLMSIISLQTYAVEVPHHIAEAIPNARLSGGGPFRYFGFHIYDAQLWVGDEGYKPDAPFAIDLNYARNFDGEEIAKTSREEMERMQYGTAVQQEQWFGQMKAIFPDVKKGQHITGVFTAQGVHFFFNGKAIGEVRNAAFSKAFAAIWMDPRTKANKVREQMLTGANPVH